MEVVGTTSAIVTLIQITARVISICYDYQIGIRHYSKDVIQITHELQSLRNVLERLVDNTTLRDDSDSVALPALHSLNSLGGPLDKCIMELKQLEVRLAPREGRLKQIGRALKWPLLEKEVQKTLGVLARQRGLFQLALTTDHAVMTLAIKNATSKNEERLVDLGQRLHVTALEQRKIQIFQWLAAPDPSSNHKKACQAKQRETGRWLMENPMYISWKNHQASFLWLHGTLGCGKTVLCSTIIEDVAGTCQASRRNILAYYYFDFNEIKKRTSEGLLRSLVEQVFSQNPQSAKALEALFIECGEGQREPPFKDLAQVLREVLEDFDKIYLILDALDECIEIPAVVLFLEEIRGWRNPSLHILTTSRKEVMTENVVRLLVTDQVEIQTHLVDADIRLVVRESLHTDPELSRWSDNTRADIEETLCDRSKGMFRWAVCQLDTLRKCIKPSALRKALTSLPKTLDDTYERILCNIDQDYAEDALKLLQWLAFSARPLGTQEVAEATAITLHNSPMFDPADRLRHPADILTICSSLITVTSRPISLPFESPPRESSLLRSTPPTSLTRDHTSHYEVRLAHDSVKEYLISERIKGTKAAFYSISEASTNTFLARSCLAYLMHFKEPLNDSTALYLSEYPLLRYSAEEWEFHVARSRELNPDPLMDTVLKDFFLTQDFCFVNWLDGPFGPYNAHLHAMVDRVDDSTDLRLEGRLFHASRLGLVNVCKILLEQGVSVDPPTRSTTGLVKSLSTPLQIAAHNGYEEVVRLLLDHGANVNQRSIHASTLDYAVMEGRESVVHLLLERGAEVTVEAASPYYGLRGLNSLVLAARAGNARIVRLVLLHGIYPRPKESYSEAYREAIAQGHQDAANLLLEYEADPRSPSRSNDSDDSDVEYFDVDPRWRPQVGKVETDYNATTPADDPIA